jgi:hypothetical protein
MSEEELPRETPDGRYLVVRGRLWRRSDPALPDAERERLVHELMAARRAKQAALRAHDSGARADARAAVDAAKRALGERGPVWWDDEAPDHTRRLVQNTPYADWYAEQAGSAHDSGQPRPDRPSG